MNLGAFAVQPRGCVDLVKDRVGTLGDLEILIHNRGVAWSDPEVVARMEAGESVDPGAAYCRITPSFEAPAGRHDWLNRTVFVGVAERQGTSTSFDYYAVT